MKKKPVLHPHFLRVSATGALLLGTSNQVIKFPYSLAGYHECVREIQNIKIAREDAFFKQYIPDYFFFGPLIFSPRLQQPDFKNPLIKKFLTEYFSEKKIWPKIKLKKIIELESLNWFLNNCSAQNKAAWLEQIEKISVPAASHHGDFYIKNILQSNQKLFFIDWTNFQKISCRYFDLFDFFIIKDGTSWTENIESIFDNKNIAEIAGGPISSELLVAFCLWKIAKEIRELANLHGKNIKYLKKYETLLSRIDQFRI